MQFPFKLLHQKTKPRNQFISIHLQDFKDLEQEKEFSPYAFQGIPVLDFVQTGQRMLVISPRISGKTDSLLLFSEDRGKSFRDLTSNLATEDKPETARGMAQNPQNPETVLLATDRGLYVTRNFGESWTRISDSNVIYPVVEFHPLDTNTVFLAGLSAESRKGIIETMDLESGISSVYHLPDEENPISDLLFNPWNPDEIWFAGSGDAKIGKSQDQGASWQIIWAEQDGPLQLNMKLFHAMGNMDTVYAASGSLSSEVRVSRSMDAGSSWDELYYERFFFLDALVLPFDIIRYGHDLLFYYDFALCRLDLDELNTGTSIEEERENKLEAWPNPAQGELNLSLADGRMDKVELWNLGGSLAGCWYPENERSCIDVSGLQAGTYILQVQAGTQRYQKKIIILP